MVSFSPGGGNSEPSKKVRRAAYETTSSCARSFEYLIANNRTPVVHVHMVRQNNNNGAAFDDQLFINTWKTVTVK